MTKAPCAVEIFAGAGGLALGLAQSGFAVRGIVERDRYCCETLRYNASRYFPWTTIIQEDVRRLTVPRFLRITGLSGSEIDLVSAGPPCQSFSICKIPKGGRSPRDPRDALLGQFVRFVKMIRPPFFLFENVPGLLSKSKGQIFRALLKSLGKNGYHIIHGILNAADYGVPQVRRRLFIIGSLIGSEELHFPSPTHGSLRRNSHQPGYVTIGETLSRLTSDLPNQRMPKNTAKKKRLLEKMVPGSEWKHWRHRDKWNSPSRCLTAHCRDDWVHPLQPRAGSVRELAALQTFPNDYVFCGPFNAPNNSEFGFQYKQVGNSVPVLMAKAIGETLIAHLSKTRRGTKRSQ